MKFSNSHKSTVIIFVIMMIIGFQISLFGQVSYTQIQIGAQVMQSYNSGNLLTISNRGFEYKEKRQGTATTFNYDISITRTFDKHHGAILGGGLYTTCRCIDTQLNYDDLTSTLYDNVKPCYKNYMLYFMYQYTTKLSSRWNGHVSAGPMWAKNHNMADWFYVPVKLSYFSAMAKLGIEYEISDRFSIGLNGILVRSLSDIVDNNNEGIKKRLGGSLTPLSVGLDLRVGYRF